MTEFTQLDNEHITELVTVNARSTANAGFIIFIPKLEHLQCREICNELLVTVSNAKSCSTCIETCTYSVCVFREILTAQLEGLERDFVVEQEYSFGNYYTVML